MNFLQSLILHFPKPHIHTCCTHFKTFWPSCVILRLFSKRFCIPFCYYFTVMILNHEHYLYEISYYQYISFLEYSFLYMVSHRIFMSTSLTVPDVFHSFILKVVSFLSFKCTTEIPYFITFSVSLFLKLLFPFMYDQSKAMFVKCLKILYIVSEYHKILITSISMKLAFPFFMYKSLNNIKTTQELAVDKWSSSWYIIMQTAGVFLSADC
jgi:hypothetical protein